MAHKAVTCNQTDSERARQRARESHLRAIYHKPTIDRMKGTLSDHGYYRVFNLRTRAAYHVWWNVYREHWECTCPTNNLHKRCKHVQRVMDREERRIRREALQAE